MTTIFDRPPTAFGLGCAAAVLAGLLICLPVLLRKGKTYGDWIRLCVCCIPMTWLGARLGYALSGWIMMLLEGFFDLDTGRDFLDGFRFWLGGYSLVGGVVGAAAGARLAGSWRSGSKKEYLDAAALGLPAGILIERLAEHGTQLGLGRYVTGEWLIRTGLCPLVDGEPVHPVYLYEAAVALILGLILWGIRRRKSTEGGLMGIFLMLFGLTQVLLESLRADGHMVEHFVHIQQVYAILIVFGVMLCWYLRQPEKKLWDSLISWGLFAAAIGLAIWAEFGVDRWGNEPLAYGIMTACLILIGCIAFRFRRGAAAAGKKNEKEQA